MKPLYLYLISLCFPILLQAQVSKTLEVTAGNLSSLLTAEEKTSITHLTLTGTVDANDISAIQNEMPALTELDMSLTTMSACTVTGVDDFPANWFPGPSIGKNSLNYGGLNKPLLTSLKLPSQLEVLGSGALSNCSGLTSITIPSTVTSIGWSAFEGCTGLTTLDIPASVTHLDQWVFSGCSALTEISIPSSITYLPRGVFQGCSSLTSVTIPSSVTQIEMDAFSHCDGLTTLILPTELTSISAGAFFQCPNLAFIHSHNPNAPLISSDSFSDVNYSACTLYVPFGSKALYAAAEGWQDFANIEEMPGLSLSVNAVTLAAKNGSTGTVVLSSNAAWAANSDQLWLTVSPVSGNGNEAITLTANRNNSGATRTATVSVSLAEGEPQTVIVTQEANNPNQAPVARAGADQSANERSTVTLDGSESSDADNDDVLTYLWTAPEGITLSSASAAKPTFTAPEVNADTNFTFSLVVNDGTESSAADEVVVTIRNVNRTPVANAGDNQSVNEGTTVTLDGSASSDPDDDELTYLWTVPEGIELSAVTSEHPNFTAPEVNSDTDYSFTLVVNDGTVNSSADEVTIHVRAQNNAPVANAGENQTVNEGTTVTLDGSASLDPDDDELTYLWTVPEGIELSAVTSEHPTFTAPMVNEDTDYSFSLVVNDGTVNSSADEVVIHVRAGNQAPVANAGADLVVHEGALITLDGSASSDPDNDPLTYLWTAPQGIVLSDNSVRPTFTAPEVGVDTAYIFSLAVSDGQGISPAHQVTVTVLNSTISQHFSAVRIGDENEQMNFYVSMAKINGADLQQGDEIAIFDGLTCVGAAVIRQVLESSNPLCIKVYLDNPATFIKDGFITGHSPTVRIWKSVTNTEAILQVFDYEPGSSQVFEVRGKSVIAINSIYTDLVELMEGIALLGSNYPNPFSNQTTIPYVIAQNTAVDISIYDMTGRKITTLVHGNLQPGDYTVTWNKDGQVKPGVYICKMQTGDSALTKLIIAE